MLAIAAGTFIFSTAMTPVQIFVLCLVVTHYIPCLATFGVIARDLVRAIAKKQMGFVLSPVKATIANAVRSMF
jgi:Fe2+ transport system protein B